MGEYANIKSKEFFQFLDWLKNHKDIQILPGTKHVVKAKATKTNLVYPLPLNHRVVSKHIVKAFRDWLIINNICTLEEFDGHVK